MATINFPVGPVLWYRGVVERVLGFDDGHSRMPLVHEALRAAVEAAEVDRTFSGGSSDLELLCVPFDAAVLVVAEVRGLLRDPDSRDASEALGGDLRHLAERFGNAVAFAVLYPKE